MTKYSFIYEYEDNDVDDLIHIKIDEGYFSGIIYKYGRVRFGNKTAEGYKDINFQYNIVKDIDNLIVKDNEQKFINVIGDILISIMEKQHEVVKGNISEQY